jgi:DNA replication ATP-dependent helicase Dna2
MRNAQKKAQQEDKAQGKNWENVYGQLRDHYRMHQQIAEQISRHYEEGLVPGRPEQTSVAPAYELPENDLLYRLAQSRILFVESPSEPALKKNRKEACLAAAIALRLVREGKVKPGQIGIITPFRAQIAEIKKFLPLELLQDENFLVDTVERYQGDEREIILFSTTISNPRQVGALQSLTDDKLTDRKLLVSLSRASKQFILLGNSQALGASPIYRELLGRIKDSGGFLNRDFAMKILNE